jgi:hypothetical protein
MRRRPIFCADINLAAAEKTAGIIRSEGGEAVANRADEEQTSPTAANLALLRRTNATAHYSIEAICIGALWFADRTLPGVAPTKNHGNCPLSVDRRSPEGLMVLRRTKTTGSGSASHKHFVLRGVVIASSLSNSSNVIIESRRRGMQTRSRERTGAGGSFNWGAPKRKSETQRPLPHGA